MLGLGRSSCGYALCTDLVHVTRARPSRGLDNCIGLAEPLAAIRDGRAPALGWRDDRVPVGTDVARYSR